jgi:hypothetical protein
MAACRGRHEAGRDAPEPAPADDAASWSGKKEAVRNFNITAAAGTLAAFGLATPLVVAILLPGLPLALAALAFRQWRGRDA